MKKVFYILFGLGLFLLPSIVSADSIGSTDFESGNFTGWNKGTQTGSLGNTITGNGNGTGVTIVSGQLTFNAPSHPAVGNPSTIYYAPAVTPTTWKFSPYGTYAAALQPTGSISFDAATTALGLSSAQNQAIKTLLNEQRTLSNFGGSNANPTNAAWITKNVTLSAGVTYTMSWNYIGTDYVPFNDGSITSLVPVTGSASVTVNNQVGNYALLGFTNPGTGDYSTGTYGSTGWQVSTYQVSQTGEYTLGFAVFNLGDNALSPVLLVDSEPGSTLKNGQVFGAVTPNNPSAPTVAPTIATTTTTTEAPTTTTTEPQVTTTTEAPTTTAAPSNNYSPGPKLNTVVINFSGGSCIFNGISTYSNIQIDYIGYMYLPGIDECTKEGYIFNGWAEKSNPSVSAQLPYLLDPSDNINRYFVSDNYDLVAVWSEVISVPESTTVDNLPVITQPSQPINTLPNTGNSITIFYAGAFLCLVGYLVIIFNKRMSENGK